MAVMKGNEVTPQEPLPMRKPLIRNIGKSGLLKQHRSILEDPPLHAAVVHLATPVIFESEKLYQAVWMLGPTVTALIFCQVEFGALHIANGS